MANEDNRLIAAAKSNDANKLESLLKSGLDVNFQDELNYTALLWAAKKGHSKIVNMLLNNSANIDYQDYKGRTALMLAAKYGHYDIVKMLTEKGANIFILSYSHNTAASYANSNNNESIKQYLISQGATDAADVNVGQVLFVGLACLSLSITATLLFVPLAGINLFFGTFLFAFTATMLGIALALIINDHKAMKAASNYVKEHDKEIGSPELPVDEEHNEQVDIQKDARQETRNRLFSEPQSVLPDTEMSKEKTKKECRDPAGQRKKP